MKAIRRAVTRTMAVTMRCLRALSGDDAYERYLTHHALRHAHDGPPLSRGAFYRERERVKWSGVSRCC